MAKQLNVSLAVTADTSQAKAQLQQLQTTLSQLTANSANLKLGIDAGEIKKASTEALELAAHLKQATNINTGVLDFTKLESSIRSSGKSIAAYGQSLLNLGPQGRQAFNQLAQSIVSAEVPMKRLSSLMGNFGTVLSNTIRWQFSSSMIHGFMGAIQSAYGYAQDLNASLNKIQIVTQMSDTQMSNFAESANKAAKALSTTTTSYTDAALIYYQQGIRNQAEITERTNATIKMANVTGQSAEAVSNQMTAIWNNFAKGGENLEYYADVITALGAATASSSEEISKGLQKFAAIADTVGLSYENATAALATITATTRQSADTVGTGLRTVFSRLQSLSLGETLEDGVNLTKYSSALAKVGVQVLDVNGELRNMDDVLMDLGSRWQNLTSAQQTALAQTIGGVRQYTTIMALMNNFDFYKENLDVAQNSAGTLEKQQETYEKSWKASINRVRASAETIYSSLINDQFFIQLNNNFSKFLDIINQIIAGLGGVKGLLAGLGGVLASTFNSQITNGLYKFGTGIADLFTFGGSAKTRQQTAINDLAGLMAGGTLDSKGHVIMTPGLTANPQFKNYQNQLNYQSQYMANQAYMNPMQQQMYQLADANYTQALANASNNTLNYNNLQSRISALRSSVVGEGQDTWRQDATAQANFAAFMQTQIDAGRQIGRLEGFKTNLDFSNEAYARELITKTMGYEDQYTGELSAAGMDKLIENIRTERSTALTKFKGMHNGEYGGNIDSLFAALLQSGQLESLKEEDPEKIKTALEQAQKAAQAKSKGMQAASIATNVVGGFMSATATQQGLESLNSTINQISSGLLTGRDAAIQMGSAIASTALNGVRTFTQMTAALGPIAGAIAAITTIALPYLIEGIDNLFTTPKEVLENLHSNTERAEQAAVAAKSAYDNLVNGFSTHSSLLDTLNDLTKGTLEFEQALLSANSAAYQLISDNNLSTEDWYVDSNGAVQIKKEAQTRLQEEALAEQKRAQSEAYTAKAIEQNAKVKYQTDKAQEIYDDIYNWNYTTQRRKWESESGYKSQRNDIESQMRKLSGSYQYEQDLSLTNNEWALANRPEEVAAAKERIARVQEQLAAFQSQIDALDAGFEFSEANIKDWSKLEKFAKENGMSLEEVRQGIISGDFQRQQMISSGAANNNRIALTNSLLASSGNSQLSTAESLLVDAMSTSTDFWNQVSSAGSQVKAQFGAEYDSFSGAMIKEAYEGMLDLNSEAIQSQSLTWLKDLYLDNAGENAQKQLDALINSDDYKNAKTSEQKKMIANALQTYLATTEQKKLSDEIMNAVPPRLKKEIDNFSQLNAEKAADLSAELLLQNDPYVQQLGNTVKEKFSQYQRAFLEASYAVAEDKETREKYDQYAKELSIENMEAATNIRNSFLQAYGLDTGNLVFEQVANDLAQGNTALKTAFQNFEFTGSTITDLANIKAGKTSLGAFDETISDNLAAMIYNSIQKDVGAQGLFEELYNSEEFADNLKTLQKELKTTGDIGADSILEMADETELLSDYLKVSGTNASGLAKALKALDSGSISNVTDTLLAALSAAGEVENTLAEVYNYIDNFEEKRSVSDIGDFYSDRADAVQAGFESGMLLDEPLLQSMDEIFGAKKRAEYQNAIYDLTDDNNRTPEQISDAINSQFAEEIAAMKSIQDRGNLSGMFEYYENKLGEGKESMFSYNKKTGQVEAIKTEDLEANGWGTESGFIQGLQKNYGVSEQMAKSMAAEYAATNGTAAKLWRQNASIEGIGKFTEALGNGETIDASQLRAFYDQYGDVLGSLSQEQLSNVFGEDVLNNIDNFNGKIESADQLVQMFKNSTEGTKGVVVDLGKNFNFASKNLQDLKDAYEENNEGKDFVNDYFKKDLKTSQVTSTYEEREGEYGLGAEVEAVDFNEATKKLTDLGASAEQAYTKLDEMREAGDISAFTRSVKDANGNMIDLNSESEAFKEYCKDNGLKENAAAFDQWTSSIADSEAELAAAQKQTDILAEAFVSSFTKLGADGVDVKFNVDETGFDSVNTIITNIEKEHKTVITATFPTLTEAEGKMGAFVDKEITITINRGGDGWEMPSVGTHGASGYNNAKGFAGGKHSNGQYEGLAEVGELGPELWIHNGQPALAGVKGRTKIYVHPDDQIYTAPQTKEILRNNPSMQDIPGFSVGYHKVNWGSSSSGSSSSSSSNNSNDYDPERYHLITRQLKDIEREYDRLSKIKEKAYGTNILKAIDAEIDAQKELIKGQEELIHEAEDWLKLDTKNLEGLLEAGELQFDANGNLANFDELQDKYKKMYDTGQDLSGSDLSDEDKEHVEEIWKAIEQYEETLDKVKDSQADLQDYIYELAELQLEKITTKLELKVDFDDKELDLIDYQLKKIGDSVYATADAIAKASEKISWTADKITGAQASINELFADMVDSEGKKIINPVTGKAYTVEEFLNLTPQERNDLNIHGDWGKALEDNLETMLDAMEDLEDMKTDGIDKFKDAFNELNNKISETIDNFDHYKNMLSTLKDIVNLQGLKLSPEMNNLIQSINESTFNNIQNKINAQQLQYEDAEKKYKQLKALAEQYKEAYGETDARTVEAFEMLAEQESNLQAIQENLLTSWQEGVDFAKTMFEEAMDSIVNNYEKAVSGMYGTLDDFQKAWDQHKKNDDFYVKDYEKYYQISKLQRSITKDLEEAAKAGNRQNARMKKLYDDLNAARADGVELTSYDLDIFAKRYEYEKALMELEDARNAKNEVRLQRDANGNWGYVYTSGEDDEDLMAKQQKVEDSLYELQKASQNRLSSLSDDMMSEMADVGNRLKDLYSQGASPEVIQDYLASVNKTYNNIRYGIEAALRDAGMTEEEAKLRYGATGFDILNNFNETLLSQITGEETLEELMSKLGIGMEDTNTAMQNATDTYNQRIEAINKWFDENGEGFAQVIDSLVGQIDEDSQTNVETTQEKITEAAKYLENVYKELEKFNTAWDNKMTELLGAEGLLQQMLTALHAMNDDDEKANQESKAVHFDSGGYTGVWGSDGRLAVLHEKENVFNADDTLNLLNAAEILRTIDLSVKTFASGLGNILLPSLNLGSNTLEQNVHIDASFPNVQEHKEIELAFDNLINKASQYANRKNMSSMTFQDMYTNQV